MKRGSACEVLLLIGVPGSSPGRRNTRRIQLARRADGLRHSAAGNARCCSVPSGPRHLSRYATSSLQGAGPRSRSARFLTLPAVPRGCRHPGLHRRVMQGVFT